VADEPRVSGRERSPNYPAMGLPAAIEAARKLWQAERRTTVPPDVAARAIGYSGLSGASRAALAGLRQYGLIEYLGGGLALSDQAVDILVHEPDSEDWMRAVRAAADGPDIFRELNQSHPDASDNAITSYLISKKRFSVDGAQKLVRALRETNSLVSRARGGYLQASPNSEVAPSGETMNTSNSGQQQPSAAQGVTVLSLLIGGGIRAEIRFFGGKPEAVHFKNLEALIKATGEIEGSST
jgi:hypothetical protein